MSKEKRVVSSRATAVYLINIDGVEQGVLQHCKRPLKMFGRMKIADTVVILKLK